MSSVSLSGRLHNTLALARRATILAKHLAASIPPNARVIDVGCGDGMIAELIQAIRSDIAIQGIDVLVRPTARVPVKAFDGSTIPYPDRSFDAAMFVDVLHHTADPLVLLKEALRVANTIIIKDHLRDGLLAGLTLRFMDWFGNAHHGVALSYNYWSHAQWNATFANLGLCARELNQSLGLYPAPASWFFERNLHFMVKLERPTA